MAISIYEKINTLDARLGKAHCIRAHGDVERLRDKFSAARSYYREAEPLYRRLLCGGENIDVQDISRGLASCLQRLGDITHLSKGADHDACLAEARELYKEALQIYENLGDRIGQANCLKGFSDIAMALDKLDEGRKFCVCAKEKYGDSGYKVGVANCAYSIGDIELRVGRLSEAMSAYEEARNIYSDIQVIHGLANCEYSVGDVNLAENRPEEAVRLYKHAQELYEMVGSTLGPANVCQGLADAHNLLHDVPLADSYGREAIRFARRAIGEHSALKTDPQFSFHFPAREGEARYGRWRR